MGSALSNQISNVLMYINCLFELMVANQFFENYLKPKKDTRQNTMFCLVASLVLTIINVNMGGGVLNSVVIVLVMYTYAKLFYIGEFKRYTYGVAIIVLTGMLCETIAVMISMFVNGSDFDYGQVKSSYLLFLATFSKTIWFIVMRFIIHFQRKSNYNYVSHGLNATLLFPVVNIISMNFMFFHIATQMSTTLLLIISATGILGLGSCIFIVRIYESSLDRSELDHQLNLALAQASYDDSIRENEQLLKQRQHEYKNSLIDIQGLIKEHQYAQANEFIDGLIQTLIRQRDLAVTTDFNNKVVNLIINNNRSICNEKGIALETRVEYPDLSFINMLDTSTLLNNAFNNAVDGCMTVPEGEPRYIRLRIYRLHDELIIGMVNSKRNEIVANQHGLLSTKDMTKNHGNGYKNMVQCARKYEGTVAYTNKGDEFYLQVRLKCE